MIQVRILISGLVQGIGFRYFVLDQARSLGITGWVRNTQDGEVEGVLQGAENKVRELVKLCRNDPGMANVEKIEEFKSNEPKYQDFVIK